MPALEPSGGFGGAHAGQMSAVDTLGRRIRSVPLPRIVRLQPAAPRPTLAVAVGPPTRGSGRGTLAVPERAEGSLGRHLSPKPGNMACRVDGPASGASTVTGSSGPGQRSSDRSGARTGLRVEVGCAPDHLAIEDGQERPQGRQPRCETLDVGAWVTGRPRPPRSRHRAAPGSRPGRPRRGGPGRQVSRARTIQAGRAQRSRQIDGLLGMEGARLRSSRRRVA